MNMRISGLLVLCSLLAACAGQPTQQDPLQNTRKLAVKGHVTLYKNGLFEVPMTTIHLIPAGPDALGLAMELGGTLPRQSVQESLQHAGEAVDLMKAGVKESRESAQTLQRGSTEVAGIIDSVTHFGMDLAKSMPGAGWDIAVVSVSYAGESYDAISSAAHEVSEESALDAKALSAGASNVSAQIWNFSRNEAVQTASDSRAAFGKSLEHTKSYILAYAVMPEQLAQRYHAAAEHMSWSDFAESARSSNEWRKELSGEMSAIILETRKSYSVAASAPFQAAGKEWEQAAKDNGYNLAMLKSMGWVLQGIFWDATIKPASKMAGAGLGYVMVNGVAIPVLMTKEAGNVLNVAVQVSWNSAAGAYDVTAPTAQAVLYGLFGTMRLLGGHTAAGVDYALGGTTALGTNVLGQTIAGATWAGGKLVSGVLYIGAPLASAGVAAGGSTVGVVVGAGGALAGTGLAVTGVASEGLVWVGGTAVSGMVLVGGSAASVATGTALGTYELSRVVVAPVGYGVGSGLVLSYGTLSQLAAQGVYLAGDVTYLVLSQEGPRWVLYAVSGKLHNGEKLPAGAVVDLKNMQQNGEKIVPVPVSEQVMQHVVESVPDQLPVVPKTGYPPSQASQDRARAQ